MRCCKGGREVLPPSKPLIGNPRESADAGATPPEKAGAPPTRAKSPQ